ncbi:MAG: putative prokaryotic signal transducing protein [Capsulimonas sp.]|jgi:hypothetical protein|nr:putative prokaryotic signal transducing protein [Capsulimonas sp.]
MTLDETSNPMSETPLERLTPPDADVEIIETQREEREADSILEDVDRYVAQTDPASLAVAEEELNAWEIPVDPLDLPEGSVTFAGDAPASVFSATSEAEAHIIQGVLEAAGIPARLHDVAMPAMGNIFSAGEEGWGQVLVPASLAEKARQVIEEARRLPPQNT